MLEARHGQLGTEFDVKLEIFSISYTSAMQPTSERYHIRTAVYSRQ
jgi:hypothetical protein